MALVYKLSGSGIVGLFVRQRLVVRANELQISTLKAGTGYKYNSLLP